MPASPAVRSVVWPDRTTLLLLIAPPLFWAGNAVVGRMLVGSVPPIALNLLRWSIALCVLAPVLWRARGRIEWRAWRSASAAMIWIGLLGVGAYNSLQYLALQTSTPVSATLIGASAPIMTLAIGAAVFGSSVRMRQWFGAAISIAGVLVVLTRGEYELLATLHFVPGDLFMLAATLSWSIYTWLLRRRRPNLPQTDFMALQMLWGIAWCAPFAALEATTSAVSFHWSFGVGAALLYIGTAPSLVAYWCWDRGVARTDATVPIFFANFTPLFAAILSALVLKQAPEIFHGVAFVLIVLGIVISLPRESAQR